MEMHENRFLKALKRKEAQLGIWVSLANNLSAEIVAAAGFDWALIDMEHSPNDYFSVLGQLQAFAGYETTPLVRVEWNDPVAVKRVLDLGAPGILFPMVQSPAEAKKAVASTRYPPHGIRGVAGGNRGAKFGRVKDYFKRVHDETAVLVQVETKVAVENALAISEVEGVDGVFFGPADIAADLGRLGQAMHEDVWDLIHPVAQQLIERGVPVGTLVIDPQFAAKLIDDGFSFVACASDVALLAKGSDEVLAGMRSTVQFA